MAFFVLFSTKKEKYQLFPRRLALKGYVKQSYPRNTCYNYFIDVSVSNAFTREIANQKEISELKRKKISDIKRKYTHLLYSLMLDIFRIYFIS